MKPSRSRHAITLLLAASTLLSACGGSQPTPDVAPTSAAALATVAPTTPPQPTAVPTLAPSPTPTDRTAKIDALAYMQAADGTAQGVVSSVSIKINPGTGHVAFAEDGPQSTGNQWQSAGWTAVLLGTLLNNADPNAYDFSFTSNGRIDGPSAGGLMTVGVLAALRGAQIKDDVTMTGTINPDGTIGPVGGIPHKIAGAAKQGKKTILVPIGQRYDMDENSQQLVDLVEVGRKNGVEVREVGTVFDAYQQITGDKLEEPTAPSASPALPQQAADRLRASTLNLVGTYQKERAQVMALQEAARTPFNDNISYADEEVNKADQSLQQGLFAVAYNHALSAASTMRQVNTAGLLTERYTSNGLDGALSQLESASAVSTQIEAMVRSLQAKKVSTANDAVTVFDAYSEIAIGEGKIVLANSIVDDLKQNGSQYSEDEVFNQVFEAARLYTEAGDSVQLAQDATEIGLGFGKSKAPSAEHTGLVAKNMQRAADANISTFESIFVQPAASQLGMSAEAFQSKLAVKEPMYNLARASQAGSAALTQITGDGQSSALVFGQAQTTYTLASMLIAKYYSLDAQLDDNLQITSFNRTKALGEMLDFADRRARTLIAQAGDETPMRALAYFESAQELRQSGDPNAKLDALSYYWQASLLSQMATYMANQK